MEGLEAQRLAVKETQPIPPADQEEVLLVLGRVADQVEAAQQVQMELGLLAGPMLQALFQLVAGQAMEEGQSVALPLLRLSAELEEIIQEDQEAGPLEIAAAAGEGHWVVVVVVVVEQQEAVVSAASGANTILRMALVVAAGLRVTPEEPQETAVFMAARAAVQEDTTPHFRQEPMV